MNDSGLVCNELVFSTAFMLPQKPLQVAKPREPTDFLNVFKEAGMFIILSPSPHYGIEGCQPRILIHPSPVTGSELLNLSFDTFLAFWGWSEMNYPPFFWLASLSIKPQEAQAIIDMGNLGFLLRQLQMKFRL